LVIDATGAAPDPMFQEAPPALRAVIVRARRGETQAQVELAQSFLKGQGIGLDPVAAARWSDEAAAQGDPTAQFILGTLYAEGIKPNARLAFDWFSAAASRGNVKAMHNLAIAYLNGTGVTQDSQAAAAWFEKAAAAGYRDSAFDLAVLYERGEGVAQSGPDALKWYDQAASFGDPEAMQRATFLRSQLLQIAKR
jgi:TPR repeat protein